MLHPPTGRDRGPLETQFSRRRLLAGGRGLLVLALPWPAAACASQPAEPDPLEEQLRAARSDSDLAAAAAKAAPAALLPALAEIAAERGRHATALIEELARSAGKPTPTETPAPTATTTGPVPVPPPPPSVAEVADALRRSADSAAKLVPTLAGYRAGLLGSIAAACAASYQVGLPPRKRPQ